MNLNEFWAQFKGNRIDLNNSKDESGKGAFEKNEKLQLLFNFFDIDGNGELDEGEVVKLSNKIKTYSKLNNNSIFDSDEQEQFLKFEQREITDEKGNILNASLELLGVTKQDLLDFVKILGESFGKYNAIPHEELEAIYFLEKAVAEGDQAMEAHNDSYGVVSATVDMWRQIFSQQYTRSEAKSNLSKTKTDAILLEKAAKKSSREFNETFERLRQVPFNKEAIEDCTDKSKAYASVKTTREMMEKIKEDMGATAGKAGKYMDASSAIINALSMCGIKDRNQIDFILNLIEQKVKNNPEFSRYGGDLRINKTKSGGWAIYRNDTNGYPAIATPEQLRCVVQEISRMLDEQFVMSYLPLQDDGSENPEYQYRPDMSREELAELADKIENKYKTDYEDAFATAYGGEDPAKFAQMYIEKEQQGVQYIQTGLNIAAMALMFIPGGALASAPGWLAKGVQTAKTVTPFLMVTHPMDFLEKWTSNGISKEEFEEWFMSCGESALFMGMGMGVSKIAESLASVYKTGKLVSLLKEGGRSVDDITAIIKSNPTKFPEEVVESLKHVDKMSKLLQISTESALDLSTSYAMTKKLHGEGLTTFDWIQSVASAVAGGTLQKQFAPLSTEAKVKHLQDAFKEFDLSEHDALRILQEMDRISAGEYDKSAQIGKQKFGLEDKTSANHLDEVVIRPENTGVESAKVSGEPKLADAYTTEEFENLKQNTITDTDIKNYSDEKLEALAADLKAEAEKPIYNSKSSAFEMMGMKMLSNIDKIQNEINVRKANKQKALQSNPFQVMKPTNASTITSPGITFRPNPEGAPAKAYRLIWCDTVAETIARNKEQGIPLELFRDSATGEYKLGIKHSWDDGYFSVDRESAIVNYDYTAKEPSDWAVVAEDEGAQIFSKTYLNQETGKTANLSDIEPGQGMVIVKNPESTVGASAFEDGRHMTSLEEDMGNVDFVRTDVDGHPYGTFNQLVKDIDKGKLIADPNDPNSAKFVELVKEGKKAEAEGNADKANEYYNKAKKLLADATKEKESVKPESTKTEVKPESTKTEVKPESTKTEVKPESTKTEVKPEDYERILLEAVKDCGEPKVEKIFFNDVRETYTDSEGRVVAVVDKSNGKIEQMKIAEYETKDSRAKLYEYVDPASNSIGTIRVKRATKSEIDAFSKRMQDSLNSEFKLMDSDQQAIINEWNNKKNTLETKELQKYYNALPKESRLLIGDYECKIEAHKAIIEAYSYYPDGVEELFRQRVELGRTKLSLEDVADLAATMESSPEACKRLLSLKGTEDKYHGAWRGNDRGWVHTKDKFIIDPQAIPGLVKTEEKFPGVIEQIVNDPALKDLNYEHAINSDNILSHITEAYSKDAQIVRDLYALSPSMPFVKLCEASVNSPGGVRKFINAHDVNDPYKSQFKWYSNSSTESVTKTMEYYDKYTSLFDEIATDIMPTKDGKEAGLKHWHAEDIPDVIDAYNINSELTNILRNHPENLSSNRILSFVNNTKNCSRAAKLLLESDYHLDLNKVEQDAHFVEKHYDKAVQLLGVTPKLSYEQFLEVLMTDTPVVNDKPAATNRPTMGLVDNTAKKASSHSNDKISPELMSEFENYAKDNNLKLEISKNGNVVFRDDTGKIMRRVDIDTYGKVKNDKIFVNSVPSTPTRITINSPEFKAIEAELKELHKIKPNKLTKEQKTRLTELEAKVQEQGILTARSPIVETEQISAIAKAEPRTIFLPDFSNEAQLREFGFEILEPGWYTGQSEPIDIKNPAKLKEALIKAGNKEVDGVWYNQKGEALDINNPEESLPRAGLKHITQKGWYNKNLDWFPDELTGDKVVYVFERSLPDFSNEKLMNEAGFTKEADGKWSYKDKNKYPGMLSETDVINIWKQDGLGKPIDTGHGPNHELATTYVYSGKSELEYVKAEDMTPGVTVEAQKCASGNICVLPVGEKVFTSEGVVIVKPGEVAIIKEGSNSIFLTTIDKLNRMYVPDPMNPTSKELFGLSKIFDKLLPLTEEQKKLAKENGVKYDKSPLTAEEIALAKKYGINYEKGPITEAQAIELQAKIANIFETINKGQKLIEILGTGEAPKDLKEEYEVAARISKKIDEKYLSRIDCSDFNKGIKEAGKVMDEILADPNLNDAQKDAAIMGIMAHMITTTNLHQHGKGSTPKEITLALAKEKGLPDATIKEIEDAYAKAEKGYTALHEFNKAYDVIGQVIRTPEDYKASIDGIIRESMKRGQLVCEIRCACDSLKDGTTGQPLSPREGTLAILNAIEEVKAEIRAEGLEPPKTSFVFLTFRGKGWDGSIPMATTQALEAVRIAQEHPEMKFGFDIAGPEDTGWGPKAFKEAIDVINKYNADVESGKIEGNTIGITMHAGETPSYEGGEGYQSVLDAIEMGAKRVGHGVALARYLKKLETSDPAEFARVLKLVKDSGVTIEICGVCNIQSIPINSADMNQHAIQTFLEYEIPVSICTDNDAICGTNISKEYTQFLLTGHSNFMDWNAIKKSVRDGVDAAFIPEADKADVRAELESRIAKVQQCYEDAKARANEKKKK